MLTRRQFVNRVGATTAGTLLGSIVSSGRTLAGEPASTVRLKRAEAIRYRYQHSTGLREQRIIRLTGDDGSVGAAPGFFATDDAEKAVGVLRDVNLLDHDAVCRQLAASDISGYGRATLDNACWDLHAHREDVPAWKLLGGKRRDSYPAYGDCRWRDTMTLDDYARSVAGAFKSRGMLATKLHLPGAYALDRSYARGIGEQGMTVDDLCTVLRKTREAVGDEVVLAYDPHPQEAAAETIDDARRILDVLVDCNYEWIESPLPSLPAESRMPEWIKLRKEYPIRFQMEEHRPSKERLVEQLIRWAEAGAIDQFTWDCTTDYGGITAAQRLVAWIRANPKVKVKLNLHYKQPAHQHVAAAAEPEIYPYFEAGFFEGRYKDGYAKIAGWVGVYDWNWTEIEKNRI